MITIKTPQEIELLAKGGRILAQVLEELRQAVAIGVSTRELDNLSEELIIKVGGRPSFKGYGKKNPYPDALCTSINEEIVHCVPSERKIVDGDIVSLDIGMQWPAANGLYTDHALTIGVGKISAQEQELIAVTKGCLDKVISILKPGMYVNDIGRIIEEYVLSRGDYGIVRDLVGHGVGYEVHEEPKIVNFKTDTQGPELKAGMVLAIEPMITLGGPEIQVADNGWDISTADGSKAAHFEHTLALTKQGCQVITKL